MISRILTDIPNIRIAVFAQGDYIDHGRTYVTKFIDFTTDKNKLVKFVEKVEATGGGDYEECYELVLQEAREKLSWIPGSQRAMVMIGDAIPHSVNDYRHIMSSFTFVKKPIDWRKEAELLIGIGCRVYAVECHSYGSNEFWAGLAYKTYGYHLTLNNFSNVFDFIMAIAYKEQGTEQLEAYRQEIIKRTPGGKGLNADLHALFDSLATDDVAGGEPSTSTGDLAADLSMLTAAKAEPKKKAARAASATKTATKRKAPASRTAPKTKVARITKSAAKKTSVMKAATKKPAAKKPATKKTATKKVAAKRPAVKKTAAKKSQAKKPGPSKKLTARKPAARAVAGKKGKAATAKKQTAKKGSDKRRGRK